jgi:hypothetical protein
MATCNTCAKRDTSRCHYWRLARMLPHLGCRDWPRKPRVKGDGQRKMKDNLTND